MSGEKYWTYQASSPTPSFEELPEGCFGGTEAQWFQLSPGMRREIVRSTLYQFLNGIRILWNINAGEYLSCINQEDREYFGDEELWKRFCNNPHKTFAGLPDQDQERIFALIERRNAAAGIGT